MCEVSGGAPGNGINTVNGLTPGPSLDYLGRDMVDSSGRAGLVVPRLRMWAECTGVILVVATGTVSSSGASKSQ